MDEQTRIRRARTFDQIAERYDRGRPEVPSHVFDDLFSLSAVDPSAANVLEIGCGTGQATRPLARRGCRIVAIEVGANLARIASRNLAGFPRVTIVDDRFEEWSPASQPFDIVFAANAWHWLDPHVCYAKAAAALKPAGVLAFIKAHHVFPPGFDPFFLEIQSTYEDIGVARMQWPPPVLEQIEDSHEEIERRGIHRAHGHRLRPPPDGAGEARVSLRPDAPSHRCPARRPYP